MPLDSYTDGLGFILEMIRVRVCFKLQIKLATNFQCHSIIEMCVGLLLLFFIFCFFIFFVFNCQVQLGFIVAHFHSACRSLCLKAKPLCSQWFNFAHKVRLFKVILLPFRDSYFTQCQVSTCLQKIFTIVVKSAL